MFCSYMISPPSVSLRPRRTPFALIHPHGICHTSQITTLLFLSPCAFLVHSFRPFSKECLPPPFHACRSQAGEIKLSMQNPTLVTHLESTLIEMPASVDSKPLTQ